MSYSRSFVQNKIEEGYIQKQLWKGSRAICLSVGEDSWAQQQPEIEKRKYSPVQLWRTRREMSYVPPFGAVSEQLLLHLESSQDAAPDCHEMSIDRGENRAEYVAHSGGNFGPTCLVPATTTTAFCESTSLKGWQLRCCPLRAGAMLL